MVNSKSFLQNFSWTFIGSTIYALSQWLLIVVLAKFGSAEVVGQFSLGLAITAPIILFSNMQLRNIIATDSVNQYSFSEYYGTRIILLLLAFLVIIGVVLIGPYDPIVSIIIILVGLSKIFESLSELAHGYFQKIERMDYAGRSMIFKSLSSLFAFSVSYIITKSLIIGLLGLILAWALRLFLYDLKITKLYTNIRPTYKNIQLLILFVLPLGFVSILNSLNTNIPRYFLERVGGLDDLGYFSAIAYILVAGNLLIRPLSLVAAPKLAKSYQNNDKKKFVKITLALLFFAFIIGIIAITIVYFSGELILTIIYDSSYADYNNIFVIIMIGSIISYFTTFLNSSIIAARVFKKHPYINLITMIVGMVASIILIPRYGIEGAAYVTVTVFTTQFFGSMGLFIFTLKDGKD